MPTCSLFLVIVVVLLSEVSGEGYLATLAGFSAGLQDGKGNDAQFRYPIWLAMSHDEGSVYIADRGNHLIRRYVISSGEVLHVAGCQSGCSGFADGVGPYARFHDPVSIAMHPKDVYLLVADVFNDRIRKTSTITGEVTTVAGNGARSSIDGYGTAASINHPHSVAIDPRGDYALIADYAGHRLRRLDLVTFALITVAGNGNAGYALGSGPYVYLNNPGGISISPDGSFSLFADSNHVIFKLDLITNVVSLFCGAGAGHASGPCPSAKFYYPGQMVVTDDLSRVYVSDSGNNRVVCIDMATRYVTQLVGNGAETLDGPASTAKLFNPIGMVMNHDQSRLYIAAYNAHLLRSFSFNGQPPTRQPTVSPYDTSGQVWTFAGSTFSGYLDDYYNFAMFNMPHKFILSLDRSFAIVCDTMNHVIRSVNAATREVSLLAGSGSAGFADGVGTSVKFNLPTHIAINPVDGNAFITDHIGNRVRCLIHATHEVTTLAGSGVTGSTDAIGTSATFNRPTGIAIDPFGIFALVTETGSHLLRKIVLLSKVVTTLAGTSSAGFAEGVGMQASFKFPWGVSISSTASFALVADAGNNMIRKVELTTLAVTNYCGGLFSGRSYGACPVARFNSPRDISISPDDSYAVVADNGNKRLCLINTLTEHVLPLVGTGVQGSDDGPVSTATLNSPLSTILVNNTVYFADGHKLRYATVFQLAVPTFNPTGAPTTFPTITMMPTTFPTPTPTRKTTPGTTITLLGSGSASSIDGVGFGATTNIPMGVAFLPDKDYIIFTESFGHVVRIAHVSTGKVTTVAGSGAAGLVNGFGTSVKFRLPLAVAVHFGEEYVLICDHQNHVIRKFALATYEVSTIAGKGDHIVRDAVGTHAGFSYPAGVAIHPSGKYAVITDSTGHVVRRLSLTSLYVSTIAGSGSPSYVDGTGIFCAFSNPQGIAISPDGKYALIADYDNNIIRKLEFATLYVSTYCGTRAAGSINGDCVAASFNHPRDVQFDEYGENAIVADTNSHMIRIIHTETDTVQTLSGTGAYGNTDGGSTSARFYRPQFVAVSGQSVVVSDSNNNRLRVIYANGTLSQASTVIPTVTPTAFPSLPPSKYPSAAPTIAPTAHVSPSVVPTNFPTSMPTRTTLHPTYNPTPISPSTTSFPTVTPSFFPSLTPTLLPSKEPTLLLATFAPTTSRPTHSPTPIPFMRSTFAPTTRIPTKFPTFLPTKIPTAVPTCFPTRLTTQPTFMPSFAPSSAPSHAPILQPIETYSPTTWPSRLPSLQPILTLRPSAREEIVTPPPTPSADITLNVSLFAGFRATGAKGYKDSFNEPTGIIVAIDETYLILLDTLNHVLHKVTTNFGVVTTFAGVSGVSGLRNGIGDEALFSHPTHGAIHPHGDYCLIVDFRNRMIRKITVYFREVTVFAGSGADEVRDGVGSEAAFSRPFNIAISPRGDMALVSDIGISGLRTIDLDTITVSTIYSVHHSLISPFGLSYFPGGLLALITDRDAHTIYIMNITSRSITPFCGVKGRAGFVDGACDEAKLKYPASARIYGNDVLVAGSGNHVVYIIDMMTMTIKSMAGTGIAGYLNGFATNAQFSSPSDVVKVGGEYFVCDRGNGVVRNIKEISTSVKEKGESNDSLSINWRNMFLYILGSLLFAMIVAMVLMCMKKKPQDEAINDRENAANDEAFNVQIYVNDEGI